MKQQHTARTHPLRRSGQRPALRQRSLGPSIALALQAGLFCFAGAAQAQTFNDLLVFETSNQSLWSSGAATGWSYDSGLIGGSWGGGRSGSSPVNLGINGITGSANAMITPGKRVKSGELWAGSPARFLRRLSQEDVDGFSIVGGKYLDLCREYRSMLGG